MENMNNKPFNQIRLSHFLPKDSADQADVWEERTYEVVDTLPTWQWLDGVPVCVSCQPDNPQHYKTVMHALRADGKTCCCNCGSRAMREIPD